MWGLLRIAMVLILCSMDPAAAFEERAGLACGTAELRESGHSSLDSSWQRGDEKFCSAHDPARLRRAIEKARVAMLAEAFGDLGAEPGIARPKRTSLIDSDGGGEMAKALAAKPRFEIAGGALLVESLQEVGLEATPKWVRTLTKGDQTGNATRVSVQAIAYGAPAPKEAVTISLSRSHRLPTIGETVWGVKFSGTW